MNNAPPITRNIAKSGEVHIWDGFHPFQLHFGLIRNHSQSATILILNVATNANNTCHNRQFLT